MKPSSSASKAVHIGSPKPARYYVSFWLNGIKKRIEDTEKVGDLWKSYQFCVRLAGGLDLAYCLHLIDTACFERWDAYVTSKLEPWVFEPDSGIP